MNEKKRKSPRTRIAVIYGGRGSEREVSISGYKYLDSVIDKEKYLVLPIEIKKSGEWVAKSGARETRVNPISRGGKSGFLKESGGFIPTRLVFPLLHGEYGEDGSIQGLLDSLGFKYVGCGVCAGALCFDKIYSKILAEALGIPTLAWISDAGGESAAAVKKRAEDTIGYPMFIKPARQGSSVGASAVFCPDAFLPALNEARAAGHGRVIIELYAEEKRELEVAFLSAFGKDLYTPPGEVSIRGFYSYSKKYSSSSSVRLYDRAAIDEATAILAREYARRIVSGADVRGISRIDFFLSDGKLYFNEINTMPGFTEGSLYPRMISASGIPPHSLISLLIEDARRDRHT